MTKQSKYYITKGGDKIWYPATDENPPLTYFHREETYYLDALHREDGPAVEQRDGTKIWYNNGLCHRLDGPAAEEKDGTKHWYINGNAHRIDGPAIEYPNGTNRWIIDNNELPAEEVEEWIKENNINLKTTEGQMAFKLKWS